MNWRHATSFIHQRRRPGGDATWRHIAFLNLNHRPGASASRRRTPLPTSVRRRRHEDRKRANDNNQQALATSVADIDQTALHDAGRTGVMRISQPASRFVSR